MKTDLFVRANKTSVLPGFKLTLGYTVLYLGLIVLIPLACTFWKTSELTWGQFWHVVTAPRVLASYRLSFGASFLAALTNLFFGLLVAWVLVRYQFGANGSWTRWWTCPSHCRRRWPASR